MWKDDHLHDLINETVISVTKKVAGILLSPSPPPNDEAAQDWSVIKISLSGTENSEISFYYRAQPQVYRAIAEHMKRKPVDDEKDMEIYIKEYFNILCGRIISRINREAKTSMRFGLPIYYKSFAGTDDEPVFRMCFECMETNGNVCITGMSKKVTLEEGLAGDGGRSAALENIG